MSRTLLPLALLIGCAPDTTEMGSSLDRAAETAAWDQEHAYRTTDGLIETFFTRPGTDRGDEEDPELDDAVASLFDSATTSIDLCLYEFDRERIVDALLAAHARGVTVRFVGDGDEVHDDGYDDMVAAGISLSLRKPKDRIMHNKFAIIDGRWVWSGSTNFSENGVMLNNNGSLSFDSTEMADLYQIEFDQMFEDGLFGRKKAPIDTSTPVVVGDAHIDVYFSPMGPSDQGLLNALDSADHTVFFMIFAYTKAEVVDLMIDLHDDGIQVVGIFDESQGRGRYSIDEKLAKAGVPVFIDGNHNAIGWAGGKLHHKTMLIDPLTEDDPIVTVGSYNWSKSATKYNDENLLVIHSPELAAAYADEFCRLLSVATPHPDYTGEIPDPCAALLQQVRINEILANPAGADGGREWVEVVNAGRAPVDIGGWMLGDTTREGRHTFATRILGPGEAVVVAAGTAADPAPNRVIATTGNLSLSNGSDLVVLRDASGVVVDQLAYSGAKSGVSFNRAEDGALSGDFVLHTDLGANSSPGWMVDDAPWGGDLIINELLPNPVGTDAGNEWIELVNVGTASIDVGGWTVSDLTRLRHTFPAGTVIRAGQAFILNDTDADDGSLSLNNAGDTITLADPGGFTRSEAVYPSSSEGVSLNRAVDGGRLEAFTDHDSLGADTSPGTRADGSPWGGSVMINEVYPNPPGADKEQEFIELVNVGTLSADLTGWTVGDAVNPARHVFGSTVLAPGESTVVWDGGGHPGDALATTGVLSLNNSGDMVTLHDDSGALRDAVTYGAAPSGTSLNRADDGSPDAILAPHDEVGSGDSSPGTRADGSAW